MKVLLCTPYDFSGVTPGGISIWAKNIFDYNADNLDGVELHLYDFTRRHYINENTGILNRIYQGISDYCKFIREISKKAREEKYDAIHINTTASLGTIKDVVLCSILRRKGIRTYLHYHFGRIPSLSKQKNWEWKMISKSIKLAHKAIVMDHHSYETLIECGFKNVVELPNPYSPELEEIVVEKQMSINRKKGRVLFAGRVFRQKGIYELVEACSSIKDIELRIVGPYEKSDYENLMTIAKDGDWISFVGPVPHEKVIEEMLGCELFVMPTYTEGFPNVVLECMVSKTPIIVTPVGAIPQMLDFDGSPCGISIKPKDSNEITNAINKLIGNGDLQREYTERGYSRVQALYSRNSIGEQLYKIWQN